MSESVSNGSGSVVRVFQPGDRIAIELPDKTVHGTVVEGSEGRTVIRIDEPSSPACPSCGAPVSCSCEGSGA